MQKIQLAKLKSNKRDKIFLCYERDSGSKWVDELTRNLEAHLKQRDGVTPDDILWSDKSLEPNDDWEDNIFKAIDTSTIAVCFLSTFFFGADYIIDTELPRILKQRKEGLISVHLIFVSSCEDLFYKSFLNIYCIQTANEPDKPLDILESDGIRSRVLSKVAAKKKGARLELFCRPQTS
ncbi:MAG TPA: TIR domain-containing protein [Thiotrichaceae bacterium]|nr:TIR domain-containing protein [Thiotrichaceae bacterium]